MYNVHVWELWARHCGIFGCRVSVFHGVDSFNVVKAAVWFCSDILNY